MFTWPKIILVALQLFSAFWRFFVSAKDRALGHAEAEKEALEAQAKQNAQAVEEANKAESEHAKHPDSDDAFDQDFKRKD